MTNKDSTDQENVILSTSSASSSAEYKATPEQWAEVEHFAKVAPQLGRWEPGQLASALLELRSRIAALEATEKNRELAAYAAAASRRGPAPSEDAEVTTELDCDHPWTTLTVSPLLNGTAYVGMSVYCHDCKKNLLTDGHVILGRMS